MNKILYYIIYSYTYLHALLPLRLLYVLSDILYFWVYIVAGYRLKVVRENLSGSFPEKPEKELRLIERKFYHHFCDYFVETIKLLHISDEEMSRRMKFENMEQVNELMKDGNSVLMFLGHYCNWEWVTSINLNFKDEENIVLSQIYKPLKNKAFDDLFLKIRSRFGSLGIPRYETLRTIVKLRRDKKQTMIGFMADQLPSINNIHYWTDFLNQDSAVFTGVERIAKKTGFAVTYLDVQKESRGYYKATIKLISNNPAEEPGFKITETYIRAMEKTILREPAYWLWTHKRWKRSRREVQEMQHPHK
ncbi:MAG: lysophospholipid acyltransferase family protein [Prevotella sp.]|nr:lysophospholipid acyltransferase family protein [Prevotella sp.]